MIMSLSFDSYCDLKSYVVDVALSEYADSGGFESDSGSTSLYDSSMPLIDKATDELQSEKQMNAPDYIINFANSKSFCVGSVDMVNSTKISAQLGLEKISRYYQMFLNSLSKIVVRFGGIVIKTVGDCLVYYFPESSKNFNTYGLMSCLECSLALIEVRSAINKKLADEKLPPLDYRISADYGPAVIMTQNGSLSPDLIGPPVNMCCKINRCAKKNGCVIGGDLFQMVRSLKGYSFKSMSGFSIGLKNSYPVYEVSRDL